MRPLFLLLVSACSVPLPVDTGAVAPLDLAAFDPAAVEPLALGAHRPDPTVCPPSTWGIEGAALEVQTGACDYFAAAWPSPAGEVLTAVIWHGELDALEPATAHTALWRGDAVIWERTVPIPAPAAVYRVEVPIAGGDGPLGWHLHNHGFNSWTLAEVVVF